MTVPIEDQDFECVVTQFHGQGVFVADRTFTSVLLTQTVDDTVIPISTTWELENYVSNSNWWRLVFSGNLPYGVYDWSLSIRAPTTGGGEGDIRRSGQLYVFRPSAYFYLATLANSAPDAPDDFEGTGWSSTPPTPTIHRRYVWAAYRYPYNEWKRPEGPRWGNPFLYDEYESTPQPNLVPQIGQPADMVWTTGVAVDGVTIDGGYGGDGDLTNTLTGTLPEGVTYEVNTDGNFEFSGTPTVPQSATEYTVTVEDEDGDEVSQTFTIKVIPETIYIFDLLENKVGQFRTELQRLALSNLMTVFMSANGTLIGQSRDARVARSVSLTFDDDSLLLKRTRAVTRSEREAPNSVRVWYNPRELEEDVSLWKVSDTRAIRVPPEGETSLGITFTDPDSRTVNVAANELEIENVVARDNEDGTGSTRTSEVTSDIISSGPKWAVLDFANAREDEVWITDGEVVGTIFRSYERQYAEARDEDDIAATGERRIEHSAPYILGHADAQAVADDLLAIYHHDRPAISHIQQWVYGVNEAGLLDIELGDKVHVNDAENRYDQDCIVERIDWSFKEGEYPRLQLTLSVTSETR